MCSKFNLKVIAIVSKANALCLLENYNGDLCIPFFIGLYLAIRQS